MNKYIYAFFTIAIIMDITVALTVTSAVCQGEGGVNQFVGDDHQGEGVSVASKKYSLSSGQEQENESTPSWTSTPKAKRINRFLKEEVKLPLLGISLGGSVGLQQPRNPRAASDCNKNNYICYAKGSPGSTCCNNKCVDLISDRDNCGACKKKCRFYSQTCCDGKCVNLSCDVQHCGRCNNKCRTGGLCSYGNCDYA
ncbi:hypothetical protein MKW92_029772 [Papaver armeniacum]|nr:hypothetical protein MKW92_029772 [Papaver armeniacum]